jgi:parallel beta-helix repeat protein
MLLAFGSLCLASGPNIAIDGEVYPSIQAAIDGALPGAVIEIGPGTYVESLTIERPLTLKVTDGKDAVLQAADPNSPAIRIKAKGTVSIVGLTICGSSVGVDFAEARMVLRNNTILVQDTGIQGGNFHVQTGSVMVGNRFQGPSDERKLLGVGLILIGDTAWTITENDFQQLATGLVLGGSIDAHVEANQITACGDGLRIGSIASVALRKNEIVDNLVSGTVLSESAHVVFDENTVRDNGQYGICIANSDASFPGAIAGEDNDIGGNGRLDLYPVTFVWPEEFTRKP